MSNEPIGIYAEQMAKRAAIVAHLSPAARHAHFPKIYAKPVPCDKDPEEERRELKRLRLEAPILRAKIVALRAKVMFLEVALEARKHTAAAALPRESTSRIIAIVARHFDVLPSNLESPARPARFVRPRFACYRILLDLLNLSTTNIGRCFNRDHTTVVHGLRAAQSLIDTDPEWRRRYDAARLEIEGNSK